MMPLVAIIWRFPKAWGYPQIIHINLVVHYKPFWRFLEYPHLRKPHVAVVASRFLSVIAVTKVAPGLLAPNFVDSIADFL